MQAVLELEDGTKYYGQTFGYNKSVSGEVVFNTSMVGYIESLTDPSYAKQILVYTYPLIGNYGVPSDNYDEQKILNKFESKKIQVEGVIVSENTDGNYHYESCKSFNNWLIENQIPGICNIDTRALTLKLREHGTIVGRIYNKNTDIPDFISYKNLDLVKMVSTEHEYVINEQGKFKVIVVDCGVKNSILKQLSKRDLHLRIVPYNCDFLKYFKNGQYHGLFLSNGPGDPHNNDILVNNIKDFLDYNETLDKKIPLFAICLGHQLLSLAIGCHIGKMKYGNRGINQPAMDMRNGMSYITSQNHGYALETISLPQDWTSFFINLNDLSNEGIIHKYKPYFSVQFHPEAKCGPEDTSFLFDMFLNKIKNSNFSEMTTLQVHDLEKPIYKKVLILGSGGLSIGQAGEFDYSGSQAIKALKEENIKTVLINPNIATVQTSWNMADEVYFLPVKTNFVEEVIKIEKPDGILATFGGQTALNCLRDLVEDCILDKYNVKIMGTPIETIIASEDRGIFAEKMNEINQPVAPSRTASNLVEALDAIEEIGFPVIIRAAFALGGLGSGFAENEDEFIEKINSALINSPQVLIEKSLKGWKEVEYEVVRDKFGNCITVCNMENFDPLGVHTGDSIVVAPSQTLTNDEYYMLRKASIDIIQHLGVVGECNVQYALDKYSKNYYVIEVNARLSRSSALASKATGYPLAYVAAKLSLEVPLSDIKNSVTKKTTAFYEPSLDYIVVKVPRWDLNKFSGVSKNIGSSMKSVGEVMAIGRSFEEAFNKALRMSDDSGDGIYSYKNIDITNDRLIECLKNPCVERVSYIMKAFSINLTVKQISNYTNIDLWFINKVYNIYKTIVSFEGRNIYDIGKDHLYNAKKIGLSDEQISRALKSNEDVVRNKRIQLNIKPVVKKIDTSGGEFPAETNYLYLTYNGSENDIEFNINGVIVLGCGSYRIGSSVEFDWCAVSCLDTLKKYNKHSIMINYNPETVSTDYDMCDRLYFEEITLERVLDIYQYENPEGVIVSVGGQVPNNIAIKLYNNNVKILGTNPISIDNAEDRSKFSDLLDKLNIDQPEWSKFTHIEDAIAFSNKVSYPVLIRPSYVLSGAAMKVIYNEKSLINYMKNIVLSNEYPVVISKFIERSKEIEVDGVCRNGVLTNYAISEHIENAGVHSGDANIVLPAQKLYIETIKRIKKITRLITQALNISGPFNIQFLSKDNNIKVIECNLRASRSFPFVSKTYNVNFIEIATKIMLNVDFEPPAIQLYDMDYVCVKAPMFSFTRLPNVDPICGVEMASTGEVACFGTDIHDAFLKSLIATNHKIPLNNILVSIGNYDNRLYLVEYIKKLSLMNYNIYATETTSDFLNENNISNTKLLYSGPNNVFDHIKNDMIEFMINIPNNDTNNDSITNGYKLRRSCINSSVPILTNIKLASLFINSLKYYRNNNFSFKSWKSYVNE